MWHSFPTVPTLGPASGPHSSSNQESQLLDRTERPTYRPKSTRPPFHAPPKGRTRRQRRKERDVIPPQPTSIRGILYASKVEKEDLLLLLDHRMAEISHRDGRYVQKMGMLRTLGHYVRNAENLNPRGLNAFRDLVGSVARNNMGVKAFTARLFNLCDGKTFRDAVTTAAREDFRHGKTARVLRGNHQGDHFQIGEAVLRDLYPDPEPAATN